MQENHGPPVQFVAVNPPPWPGWKKITFIINEIAKCGRLCPLLLFTVIGQQQPDKIVTVILSVPLTDEPVLKEWGEGLSVSHNAIVVACSPTSLLGFLLAMFTMCSLVFIQQRPCELLMKLLAQPSVMFGHPYTQTCRSLTVDSHSNVTLLSYI